MGLGSSIQYLNARHFGSGPVITMNSAVKLVQELGLSNPIYSLQKDGCHQRGVPGHQCGGTMVYPRPEIPVILPRNGYGESCLDEHPTRLWIDHVAYLGLDAEEMSIRIAVALALQVMGCDRIVFVCCNSLHSDNLDDMLRYYPDTDEVALPPTHGNYSRVRPMVLQDVSSVPYAYVTPKEARARKRVETPARGPKRALTLDMEAAADG